MFVSYYLGKANGNATEAARMAGFAHPNTLGPRQLVKVSIRAAIDAKLAQSAMSADEVLARLSDIASADMGGFVKVDAKGLPVLDLKRAKAAGRLHLIRSLKQTRYGPTLELHDAQAALEKLGKYHGLFLEKLEVTQAAAAAPRVTIPDDDDRPREDDPG